MNNKGKPVQVGEAQNFRHKEGIVELTKWSNGSWKVLWFVKLFDFTKPRQHKFFNSRLAALLFIRRLFNDSYELRTEIANEINYQTEQYSRGLREVSKFYDYVNNNMDNVYRRFIPTYTQNTRANHMEYETNAIEYYSRMVAETAAQFQKHEFTRNLFLNDCMTSLSNCVDNNWLLTTVKIHGVEYYVICKEITNPKVYMVYFGKVKEDGSIDILADCKHYNSRAEAEDAFYEIVEFFSL